MVLEGINTVYSELPNILSLKLCRKLLLNSEGEV